MCVFSAPIVLNTISLWGMSGISKILCVNYLNAEANGLFSFGSKFGSIITIFGSIIGAVLIEEAYLEKNLASYRKRFSNIIQKLFIIYLITLFFAIPLLNIIYNFLWINNDYYYSKIILPFILLSSTFSSIGTNFGSAFQVTEKTSYIFTTTMFGTIVSIVISYLTINNLGILGLALAQMIGNLILVISRALFAYKLTGLKIDWKINIFLILIYVVISFVSIYVEILINLLIIAIITLITVFLFRNDIKRLLHLAITTK